MNNNNQISNKGILYCVNRNIELISVVMLLSNYYEKYPYLKTNLHFSYLDEILVYFNGFLDHPAIKEFEKLIEVGFAFDTPLAVVIFCDEEMNLKSENIHRLNNRLENMEINQINKFLKLLHDFDKVSCFSKFFISHYDFYSNILRTNINLIPDINFKDILTEYYGISPERMEIILSVTFGGIGFCISENLKTSIILGTFNMRNDIPVAVDDSNFIKMVLHEFSHSFVSMSIDNCIISRMCFTRLYESLHKNYQEQYGSDNYLVSEQIVRAITARLVSIYIDEGQGKDLMKFDKSQTFIAVEPLYYTLLNNYESNRRKYTTFNEFMPELIAILEKI